MNILVIFTGGTIGSSMQEGSLSPDAQTQYELINQYQTHNTQLHTFQTMTSLNILSENIQPSHWTTMIESINEIDMRSIDGIILTHGTDTLSFTANALALYFTKITVPLVMVSSHLPLEHPQTNGHQNFQAALQFMEKKLPGVFVAYKNPQDEFVSIFHAYQTIQSPQLSSRFDCLEYLTASVKDNKVTMHTLPSKEAQINLQMRPYFDEDVLYIKPYPGLNYGSFNLQNHKVIVHDLYHSGTCDITKLKPFVRQCKREGILLFIAPLYKNDHYYETTQALIDMGVLCLYNISIEHALVKVMLACKNFSTQEELLDYLQM